MYASSRRLTNHFVLIGSVIFIAFLMGLLVLFHLGGVTWRFAQLTGAIIGGVLTLYAARKRVREDEDVEPWLGREQLAWTLVGCGLLMWGVGESIWRYYLFTNQKPFPSYADIGYSSLPPLVFIGMLLIPSSGVGRRKIMMVFDSLIAMGAMLAIGWYLLLGSLALASSQDVLAKFLGLYYPTTDIALLSSVVILLLRGQGSLYEANARRVSLIVVGVGLCFFSASDFIFNVQQSAGTYIDGTWVDLGWPFGMLTIGVAAYLRRFLPMTPGDVLQQRLQRRVERIGFGPAQLVTYALVGILFIVLGLNVFSTDKLQLALRPVLLLGTIGVVALVVVRQILTIIDNEYLARRQADALARLEAANQQVEEQVQLTARRNEGLEMGIMHLKEVQARLANGNLQTRAQVNIGELMPLAVSLNLLAERLSRMERADNRLEQLSRGLYELTNALERHKSGGPFVMPPGYSELPELNRLLLTLGLKERFPRGRAMSTPLPFEPPTPTQSPTSMRLASGDQPFMPSQQQKLPLTPPVNPVTPLPPTRLTGYSDKLKGSSFRRTPPLRKDTKDLNDGDLWNS
jgi:hypothetical protein